MKATAPTDSACSPPTSITMAGPTSTWPTILPPALLYQEQQERHFMDVGMEAGCVPQRRRQAAGRHGRLGRRLRPRRQSRHRENQFRRRHAVALSQSGNWSFEDDDVPGGSGRATQYLGWGCGLFDFDNDGWPDILLCNGHVYPEVEQLKDRSGISAEEDAVPEPRNGHFRRSHRSTAGPGITVPNASRGCAFGDFDNDGDIDVVVNTVNGLPQLVRCDSKLDHNWIKVKCVGTKSNRSGDRSAAEVRDHPSDEQKPHQQIDEVRSGGGYISQSDLRIHFGIGQSRQGRIDRDSLAQRAGGHHERRQSQSVGIRERRPRHRQVRASR